MRQCVLEENTDLLVFDRVSKKLGVLPTCGCLRMKLPSVGPQFIHLAIRRHVSQSMRMDSLPGMAGFHIGVVKTNAPH